MRRKKREQKREMFEGEGTRRRGERTKSEKGTYSLSVVEGSSRLDLSNDLLALGSETEIENGLAESVSEDASREGKRRTKYELLLLDLVSDLLSDGVLLRRCGEDSRSVFCGSERSEQVSPRENDVVGLVRRKKDGRVP